MKKIALLPVALLVVLSFTSCKKNKYDKSEAPLGLPFDLCILQVLFWQSLHWDGFVLLAFINLMIWSKSKSILFFIYIYQQK
jgi:hypothetical protein